jgi:CheY-like chemotaxis protein
MDQLRPTVLVVDDDRDFAMTVHQLVEGRGCRPIGAGNGSEALSVLEAERPRLMLVDLFMPVMNGAEFLRVVKQSPDLSSIPRILMTATNDPTIGIREDVTVLYKPLDVDALNTLLDRYCELPSRNQV